MTLWWAFVLQGHTHTVVRNDVIQKCMTHGINVPNMNTVSCLEQKFKARLRMQTKYKLTDIKQTAPNKSLPGHKKTTCI